MDASLLYAYQNPTLWLLLLGVLLAASSTAVIGSFNLLQKRGLAADAIAHALFPGICISFLLTHEKTAWQLTLGALASGGLAFFLLYVLPRYTGIKKENSIAIVLSIFLGLGLFLFSYIQHSGYESQAGLQHFLLGNVASLMRRDILFFIWLDIGLFALLVFLFKEWRLLSFDIQFAKAIGRPVKKMQFLFQLITLLAIIMGVQTVGIVMMSAMLLAPGAAARFWTNRLTVMLKLAALFSCIASLIGVVFSAFLQLPTGPCIVIFMNAIAFISFIVAPRRGWFARIYQQYRYKKRVWKENILKLLYQLGKKNNDYQKAYTVEELFEARPLEKRNLWIYLELLAKEKLVYKHPHGKWSLTPAGREKGEHVRRLHILWEFYLEHCMGVEASKVHGDAEVMEHLIPPNIEKSLTELVSDKTSKPT